MYHLFIALQVLGIVLTFGAEVLLLYGDGSREQKLMSQKNMMPGPVSQQKIRVLPHVRYPFYICVINF